jgi:hypothetical protein
MTTVLTNNKKSSNIGLILGSVFGSLVIVSFIGLFGYLTHKYNFFKFFVTKKVTPSNDIPLKSNLVQF